MKEILITVILITLLLCSCGADNNYIKPDPVYKWVGKTINYHIDDSLDGEPYIREQLVNVMNDIMNRTDIEFNEVNTTGDFTVLIYYGDGENRATLGMCEVPFLAISSSHQGVIYHEVLHVLGMAHEHQRPDRDEYINVAMDDVPEHIYVDFMVRSWDYFLYDYNKYGYDVDSIMHYNSKTHGGYIENKDGSKIGTKQSPTEMDWDKLNGIYK